MPVDRALHAFGGTMVTITSQTGLFHHHDWTRLTPLTGFCPAGRLMKIFGMKIDAQLAPGE